MAYRTWYQLNNNFSRVAMYLLGEIHDYTGLVDSSTVIYNLDRLMLDNKEEIRKHSNKPQAELYEEEVSDLINRRQLRTTSIVQKKSGKTMTYFNIEDVIGAMTEMTVLANNMLNCEED